MKNNMAWSHPYSNPLFAVTEKCTSCGNCKSMTISETMKPENVIFFHDPDETIKKQIKVILQVMDFQKNHRKKLFTYYRKCSNMERTCQELTDKVQRYEREILMLKKENAELKNAIKMAKAPQSPFGNSSAATGLRSNLYSPAGQPMMVSPSGLGLTSPYVLKRRYPSNMSEAMDYRTSNTMHPNNSSVFTPPLGPSRHYGPLQLSGRTPPADGKRYTPTLAGIQGVAGRWVHPPALLCKSTLSALEITYETFPHYDLHRFRLAQTRCAMLLWFWFCRTIYRNGCHSAPPAWKGTPGKSASQYFTSPMNKQDLYKRTQGASSSLSSGLLLFFLTSKTAPTGTSSLIHSKRL
uniref:Uncharacterized protein n=1 Tax=Eptatretus burgeri TaxID=7764 RepID=A0A8C4Q1Q8_EPTBU